MTEIRFVAEISYDGVFVRASPPQPSQLLAFTWAYRYLSLEGRKQPSRLLTVNLRLHIPEELTESEATDFLDRWGESAFRITAQECADNAERLIQKLDPK